MQKLRRRLEMNLFTEAEFIDIIVEGIAENTNPLLGVETVEELKRGINRYELSLLVETDP